MAEKPPVTSGEETIDCMVCLWGETALFILSVWSLIIETKFDTFSMFFAHKIIQPTLLSLHLRPKMPTFSSPGADGNRLCVASFFSFLQISTACIRKSLLIKSHFFPSLFPPFCFSARPCWGSWGRGVYLRSPTSLRLKARFSLTVFDPETGWQLSLTAAWLNARRSSHCGGQRKNLWHQHALFHWQGYSLDRVLTAADPK